ncbi:MAG TPA: hypothetical protein VM013_03930 [Dehalococcoidia bacterium]|nr:hypothetical protein [Dehalococcoidia bacterium]
MKGAIKMKTIVKVTGLIALGGAAFFALNAGSALAGPPPPFEEVVDPHIPFDAPVDPGPELDLPPFCEMAGICDHLLPIDPCVLTDTCGVDDGADEPPDDSADEPTATPTDEPTATPTDEPAATPTDEPTTAPTDVPPTAAPQPGNLPPAGNNGGIMNDVGGGVVLLAGISLGAMALAWVMFFASRRKEQTER